MLAIERRQEIMKIIRRDRSVRVNELSERFSVTEETIRRDLDKLEKEGKVKKTYGGAVLENHVAEDTSFSDRLKVNMSEKRKIAEIANNLIEDGETIFIDMSTTALEVIKHVDESKHITVITNALNALVELSQKKNIKLIGIGGTFDQGSIAMKGPMTNHFIEQYFADKTFFSVKALSLNKGVMDSKEDLAEIKRHMIANARQTILVADASKFNKTALMKVIDTDHIDVLVTEYKMDDQWQHYFEDNEVEVMIVE